MDEPSQLEGLEAIDAFIMEDNLIIDANSEGFIARAITQTILPRTKIEGSEYVMNNGNITLSILTPSEIGLPYGTIPRLLMAFISSEAIKKKEREIFLGASFSDFMINLGFKSLTGGVNGSITRFKDQAHRLFSSSISCIYKTPDGLIQGESGMRIADKHYAWWSPNTKLIKQRTLFESKVILSERFYSEITSNPVQVDFNVIKKLKSSAFNLDLYCWLQYQQSLHEPVEISWKTLKNHFGAEFKHLRFFKHKFKKATKDVHKYVRDLHITSDEKGLLLQPNHKKQLF